MKIFSGNANTALAKDIAAYLGINLGRVKVCGGGPGGKGKSGVNDRMNSYLVLLSPDSGDVG